MAIANLTLRFLLELAGIAAFGIWGMNLTSDPRVNVVVAMLAVAATIVAWALVVAPRARNGLRQPQKDVIGTAILVAAAGALVAAGQPIAGLVLGTLVLANAGVLAALGPAAREAFGPSAGQPD
jgi:hypothetical protein